jgi:Ion channel
MYFGDSEPAGAPSRLESPLQQGAPCAVAACKRMLSKLLIAFCLMALCVVIHASGLASALRWWRRRPRAAQGFWAWTGLFVGVAGWMIVLHLFEVTVWALFYVWADAIADVQVAFYFSAVTYTTTGYGDVVLPEEWRLLGGVEALTGILMCGWSTGFFFAIVSRMYEAQGRTARS